MSLRVVTGAGPVRVFEHPERVWTPHSIAESSAALSAAQDALNAGYWIAGGFTYEFGALLAGLPAQKSAHPLFLLGIFREPVWTGLADAEKFSLTAPLARVSYEDYANNVGYIRQRIRDGDVYQVNYTVPFDLRFSGDPYALYCALAGRARAEYTAFLQYGALSVVSISPEAFLSFDEDRIRTKPMKGTAPPGCERELSGEKNRAEHLMIVDLLRNDLHRICTAVDVERLFETERYPTFVTMTSTIAGNLPADATLETWLRATFPCGSVTGAPKRAAMQHIASVESQARGFYTGSIGFLSPSRRGWWNVAIRTLQIEGSRARFDAGGGIVSDSAAADEWNEIAVKSAFLAEADTEFALIETFRSGKTPSDLDAHRARLVTSARRFGLAIDESAIDAVFRKFAARGEPLLVRITLNRSGAGARTRALERIEEPVRLRFSSCRVRSDDSFLRHKTSWRPLHDEALREAHAYGCFDAILRNELDEITEGARTNIFVQSGNMLYTPPLRSGVLPGILRARLLAEGRARERVLHAKDLANAHAIFAGNSARGLLRAEIVE